MEKNLDNLKDFLLNLWGSKDKELCFLKCYLCNEVIPLSEERVIIEIGIERRFFSDAHRKQNTKLTMCYRCADKFSYALAPLLSYVSKQREKGKVSEDSIVVEEIMDVMYKLINDVVD